MWKTEKVKKQHSGKIILLVTHGIFSAGLKPIMEYIDDVYTTTSYHTADPMSEFSAHNERYLSKLHQFEVL